MPRAVLTPSFHAEKEMPMKLRYAILISVFALGSAPVLACDEICKDGEYYSDDAEMCMPKTVGS